MTERILVVAHNHPDLHPGGTEIFAHDLFRAFGRVNGISTLFLAGTNQVHRPARPGTAFQAVGRGDNEVVMWSGHFETFYLSQVDLYGVVPDLTRLLEEFQPDVVHIHHVLLLGVEFIALVRRVLPNARIVMTLHDYYSICAHNGLMLTPRTHDLCYQATPDRCRSCFPEIAAESFVIRTRYLQTIARRRGPLHHAQPVRGGSLRCVGPSAIPDPGRRERTPAYGLRAPPRIEGRASRRARLFRQSEPVEGHPGAPARHPATGGVGRGRGTAPAWRSTVPVGRLRRRDHGPAG